MAIAKISKIQLTGLNDDKETIIKLLQDMGEVEIINFEEKSNEINEADKLTEIEYNLAGLKFLITYLKDFVVENKEKISFTEKLNRIFNSKIQVTRNQFNNVIKNFDYKTAIENGTDYEKTITELNNKINDSNDKIAILKTWQNLKQLPKQNSKYSSIYLGSVKLTKYSDLIKALESEAKLSHIEKISSDDKKVNFLLIFNNEIDSEIKTVIGRFDCKQVTLPLHVGISISDEIKEYQKRIKNKEKKLADTKKEVIKMSQRLNEIKIVYAYLNWQKEQLLISNESENTSYTFNLRFWALKNRIKAIESKLSTLSKNFEISELPINDNEIVPTYLHNSNTVSSFVSLSKMAGTPGYKEIDPTIFLLPTFVIFFGFCLTDAGYGAIIAILSFLAVKFLRLPKETKSLLTVMIWCGLSTVFFGAIFGGWFGIELDKLAGSPIIDMLLKIRLINPIDQPMIVLGITFVIGIVHLMMSIAIGMYMKIRDKNLKDAILDDGLWLYFLGSIVFYVLAGAAIKTPEIVKIAQYAVLAGVALLVLTQGRKHKNIFLNAGSGILSLYGLVGYFSDMLSYSRLLALGLATSIIALVVNQIAFLFKDMIPVIGWPVAVVILIGGHIFNLGLNALGSYIHSGRLHFVEFFPKFLENSGKVFKPIKKESNFIEIIEN